MVRPHLPLNALRAFEASARHLSFTRAAIELCVTQAAISHQVKGLEARLGAALFRRLPRGLALTEGRPLQLNVLPLRADVLARASWQIRTRGGADVFLRLPLAAASVDLVWSSMALHWAADLGDLRMVDLLIKSGANVKVANRFGATPLGLAAIKGQRSCLTLFLRVAPEDALLSRALARFYRGKPCRKTLAHLERSAR